MDPAHQVYFFAESLHYSVLWLHNLCSSGHCFDLLFCTWNIAILQLRCFGLLSAWFLSEIAPVMLCLTRGMFRPLSEKFTMFGCVVFVIFCFECFKVWFFYRQSNQIWSPIYWSPINLIFRIDHRSTMFRFSMHFWSPVTWLVDWPSTEPTLCQSDWLTVTHGSDLNLQCCAKLPSMHCEWTP